MSTPARRSACAVPFRSGNVVPVDQTDATTPSPAVVVGEDGLARPAWAATDPLLREYYDTEWGMPVRDEHGLYERISLEGFQAGLSWATILRKRPAFRTAFHDFDPDIVAQYTDADVERLLGDAGIVRNRLKVAAAITNAKATINLRAEGGLIDFVWSFQPATTPEPRTYAEIQTTSAESIALSRALRAKGFAFVGPTTMHALMEAIGMIDTHLVDSHRRGTSGVWAPVPFDGEFREQGA
jgi:DNA-3-methyladenine glycosylase I